jgi:hypothetical protein
MKRPNFTPGQPVEVEIYFSAAKKSMWKTGKVINVVPADDIAYRVEVEMDSFSFTGFSAVHPDCVRPAQMTRHWAKEALIELTNKKTQVHPVAKQSLAYKTAMEAVLNPGIFQVCGKEAGSGQYSTSSSWAMSVIRLLDRAGIPHEYTNVSPQGGKHGDRVKVTL